MHLDVKRSTITTNNEIRLFFYLSSYWLFNLLVLIEEKGLHLFPMIFLFLDLRLCFACCNPICDLVPIGFFSFMEGFVFLFDWSY
jgi:hypothetical protein